MANPKCCISGCIKESEVYAEEGLCCFDHVFDSKGNNVGLIREGLYDGKEQPIQHNETPETGGAHAKLPNSKDTDK